MKNAPLFEARFVNLANVEIPALLFKECVVYHMSLSEINASRTLLTRDNVLANISGV